MCIVLQVGASPVTAATAAAAATAASSPAATLPALIQGRLLGATAAPDLPAAGQPLLRLYPPGAHQALWLDAAYRPNRAAGEALALLADAASHGLDPADYHAAPLARSAAALKAPVRADQLAAAVDFELAMSTSMLSYLQHLHVGRVHPPAIRFRIPPRAQEHDFAGMLLAALSNGRLQPAIDGFAPALGQYRSLRAALARYRALAADTRLPAWPAAVPPVRSVHPGEPYPGAAALHARLVAFGDLPAGDLPAGDLRPADASSVYDGTLVDGVVRFQRRHGLTADGVLGKSTQAALQVPLERRVRQIELAIERLRWLPHFTSQPFVAINIPMFRLWARDPAVPPGEAPLEMNVIVGRALNTQTPVFIDEMTHLIFRPYWNVPRSIVRNEILPALQREPAYLQRHDMEIVRGQGDDAQPLEASEDNIALLRQGALRLRQRPGPHNSLGLAKFVFPNDANVYLHGTPAQQLFARTRRDFSHGCVRLEDPLALAQWALRDQPAWTRERIAAAMQGSRSQQVNLLRPVQVILYYVTATVMPPDGTIHFVDDIYGHDARLDLALASRR
jgi:murein L,D-transpeptidase YcbB/YkuD